MAVNIVHGPFGIHMHDIRSDGLNTLYVNGLWANYYGIAASLATNHDRYLALYISIFGGYPAYVQEAANASSLSGQPIAPGVEWTIDLPGSPQNRESHVYLLRVFPAEFDAMIKSLAPYATSPNAAYGLKSDWTGKPNSDALLGELEALSKQYHEVLVVAHADIHEPSLVINHYNPIPADKLKGKVDYIGVEVMNHELNSTPQGILNIAAAYEAAGIHVCLIGGNDTHGLPLDFPPFYPNRWERRNWFIGPTNRPDYHTGSVVTYGDELRVTNCAPIPNLATVTSELVLQLSSRPAFTNLTWSVWSDMTCTKQLAGGPVPPTGLIRWSIPPTLNPHGVHHRYFMMVQGHDPVTGKSYPEVYVSPQEVVGP